MGTVEKINPESTVFPVEIETTTECLDSVNNSIALRELDDSQLGTSTDKQEFTKKIDYSLDTTKVNLKEPFQNEDKTTELTAESALFTAGITLEDNHDILGGTTIACLLESTIDITKTTDTTTDSTETPIGVTDVIPDSTGIIIDSEDSTHAPFNPEQTTDYTKTTWTTKNDSTTIHDSTTIEIDARADDDSTVTIATTKTDNAAVTDESTTASIDTTTVNDVTTEVVDKITEDRTLKSKYTTENLYTQTEFATVNENVRIDENADPSIERTTTNDCRESSTTDLITQTEPNDFSSHLTMEHGNEGVDDTRVKLDNDDGTTLTLGMTETVEDVVEDGNVEDTTTESRTTEEITTEYNKQTERTEETLLKEKTTESTDGAQFTTLDGDKLSTEISTYQTLIPNTPEVVETIETTETVKEDDKQTGSTEETLSEEKATEFSTLDGDKLTTEMSSHQTLTSNTTEVAETTETTVNDTYVDTTTQSMTNEETTNAIEEEIAKRIEEEEINATAKPNEETSTHILEVTTDISNEPITGQTFTAGKHKSTEEGHNSCPKLIEMCPNQIKSNEYYIPVIRILPNETYDVNNYLKLLFGKFA